MFTLFTFFAWIQIFYLCSFALMQKNQKIKAPEKLAKIYFIPL
jgi:hypothetical protein